MVVVVYTTYLGTKSARPFQIESPSPSGAEERQALHAFWTCSVLALVVVFHAFPAARHFRATLCCACIRTCRTCSATQWAARLTGKRGGVMARVHAGEWHPPQHQRYPSTCLGALHRRAEKERRLFRDDLHLAFPLQA